MMVALLQVAFDRASRSSGMQHMLDAVDRAGASQPPAELLLLPGGCDREWTLRHSSRGDSDPARSLSYVVREAIAWKAREWGLYVAVGFGGYRGDGRLAESCLFDPDGDQVACATTTTGEGTLGQSPHVASWTTAVGGIVIVACDSSLATVPSLPDNPAGNLVVLCLPHDVMDRGQRKQFADMSKSLTERGHASLGCYWAVVRKGVHECGMGEGVPRSEIFDPDGRVIAAAAPEGQSIVFMDLPM